MLSSFTPWLSTGTIQCLPSFSRVRGFSCSTSNIMGMLGPWMSASTRPTRRPSRARPAARLAVTVLLPTPPLPLATATMCFTPGSTFRRLPRSPLRADTLTNTPTSFPNACRSWKVIASSMRLRLCMAGLLTSTSTLIVLPSTLMLRTRSRVMMSFLRSGSRMRESTSRTASCVMAMACCKANVPPGRDVHERSTSFSQRSASSAASKKSTS